MIDQNNVELWGELIFAMKQLIKKIPPPVRLFGESPAAHYEQNLPHIPAKTEGLHNIDYSHAQNALQVSLPVMHRLRWDYKPE